jgi:hypothetical protein
MREIAEIKAWKTTDDQIFENEVNAHLHQRDLDLESRLMNIVDQMWSREMTKVDLLNSLVSHAVDLKAALEGV